MNSSERSVSEDSSDYMDNGIMNSEPASNRGMENLTENVELSYNRHILIHSPNTCSVDIPIIGTRHQSERSLSENSYDYMDGTGFETNSNINVAMEDSSMTMNLPQSQQSHFHRSNDAINFDSSSFRTRSSSPSARSVSENSSDYNESNVFRPETMPSTDNRTEYSPVPSSFTLSQPAVPVPETGIDESTISLDRIQQRHDYSESAAPINRNLSELIASSNISHSNASLVSSLIFQEVESAGHYTDRPPKYCSLPPPSYLEATLSAEAADECASEVEENNT